MKTLIFSDVHGNKFGLQAVLDFARGKYDAALCLGDVVGYGAHPNECCEMVRELVAASPEGACLMGNHDAAALGIIDSSWFNHVAKAAIEWTDEQLNDENRAWLESLKPTLQHETFQAVHGSLREPLEEYITDAHTAAATLEKMEAPLCFYGHTHIAEAWVLYGPARGFWARSRSEIAHAGLREGGTVTLDSAVKTLLNPGSCGQPRDGNRQARAAIWDSEANSVEVFALDYDWQAARAAIYEAGLPPMLGDRLMIGR
jgi:predicted phosphodiesterase